MSEFTRTVEEISTAYQQYRERPYEPKGTIADVIYLLDEIARLKATNRWIPVEEKLPEEFDSVLVIYGGSIFIGHFERHADGGSLWYRDDDDDRTFPTHWRPLQPPPGTDNPLPCPGCKKGMSNRCCEYMNKEAQHD